MSRPGAVINQPLSWGSARGSVIFHLVNELGLPCPAQGAASDPGCQDLCLGRLESSLLASGDGDTGQDPAPPLAQPWQTLGVQAWGSQPAALIRLGTHCPPGAEPEASRGCPKASGSGALAGSSAPALKPPKFCSPRPRCCPLWAEFRGAQSETHLQGQQGPEGVQQGTPERPLHCSLGPPTLGQSPQHGATR